jgi:hypothetical protein
MGPTAIDIITAIANLAGIRRVLKSNRFRAAEKTYPGHTKIKGKSENAKNEPNKSLIVKFKIEFT